MSLVTTEHLLSTPCNLLMSKPANLETPKTREMNRHDTVLLTMLNKHINTLTPTAAVPTPTPPAIARDVSPFRLQALPTELCYQIFECMTALPRADHLNFLLTSRSMFQHASPSFFHRPLYCSSQNKLIEFIDRHTATNLNHVQTLCIQLREVPPEHVEAYLAQIALDMPDRQHFHPFTLERDRILSALQSLPGLRHIIFLDARERPRNSPKLLLHRVHSYVSRTYTNLKSARIEDDPDSMRWLPTAIA